jgi:hypothetical protein
MEMHNRKLLEMTLIYRMLLKSLVILFNRQIYRPDLQYKRLEYGGS